MRQTHAPARNIINRSRGVNSKLLWITFFQRTCFWNNTVISRSSNAYRLY